MRDGEPVYLSTGLLPDGVWYWRSDLAHYVVKYSVALPREFLQDALANAWWPPIVSEEEAIELAAVVHRVEES